METFQDFLETMIANGVMERLTDNGLLRLLRIYTKNDLQPPADLVAAAEGRGLIPKY